MELPGLGVKLFEQRHQRPGVGLGELGRRRDVDTLAAEEVGDLRIEVGSPRDDFVDLLQLSKSRRVFPERLALVELQLLSQIERRKEIVGGIGPGVRPCRPDDRETSRSGSLQITR